MKFGLLLKKFFTLTVFAGLPLVNMYHAFTGSVFWNMEIEGASGLEYVANKVLAPSRYLFAGQLATIDGDRVSIQQQYDYKESFGLKTAASMSALPISLTVGPLLKGVAFVERDVGRRHRKVAKWIKRNADVESHNAYYESIGLNTQSYWDSDWAECENHARRPGDENNMIADREALQEIAALLDREGILFWLDCGTCLGAYRYGGVIPWDFDVDIAILQRDFKNVQTILRRLDPNKYVIQDWSGRDFPDSYLKVYVKESRSLIDIYNFRIDEDSQTIHSVVSNMKSIFLPKSWKVRESRYSVATPFSDVFPLRKGDYDGLIVPVPNKTKKYLQGRYGEDIGPNRLYNEETGRYEKDMNHPYWQLEYVH